MSYAVPPDRRETAPLSSPKTRLDHIARAVTQGSKLLGVTGVRDEQVTAHEVGRSTSFETSQVGQPDLLARHSKQSRGCFVVSAQAQLTATDDNAASCRVAG